MTKEFWVRAETSPGKWGEVELKGKALDKYTAKRTTKRGREAIIKKAVKKLNAPAKKRKAPAKKRKAPKRKAPAKKRKAPARKRRRY